MRRLGVYGLLALSFVLIASLILGSLLKGVEMLLAALAGLAAFSLLLGGGMWLALRCMPTFGLPLLRMARNRMRRQSFSLLFPMIALFIGVFTLGLAVTTVSSAVDQLARRSFSLEGVNMVVLSDPVQEGAVREALTAQGVENIHVRRESRIESVRVDGAALESAEMRVLQGRSEPWDVALQGAPWGSVTDGVYVPAGSEIALGSAVVVTGSDGVSTTLSVVGSYEPTQWEDGLLDPADGLLVDSAQFDQVNSEQSYFIVAGEADVGALASIRDEVGALLPETMVLTSIDVDDMFSSTLRNLFVFAVAMAGLALVAGAVLIANSVSLAMIERRYEIGIMKAVGYTQGQVLLLVLLEYGLVGLISSAAGLLAVELATVVLSLVQETAGELLHVRVWTGLLIVGVSLALTVVSVLGSAWRPTRVRPLVVLNQEG